MATCNGSRPRVTHPHYQVTSNVWPAYGLPSRRTARSSNPPVRPSGPTLPVPLATPLGRPVWKRPLQKATCFPLRDIAAAFKHYGAQKHFGKVCPEAFHKQ